MNIKKKIIYVDIDDDQEHQFEPIENTTILEKTENGYRLKYLTIDEDPMSPDEYGDDALFLVHYHRDFQVENKLCPKDVLGYIYTENADDYDKNGAKELQKTHHVFPVSSYIHSGVSLSLGDGFAGRLPQGHYRFDVSHVGAVCVSKEVWRKKDTARKAAESLVETWNQYLSADVYCCVAETLDADRKQIDYDICGGFYGFEYAKEALETEF